jgi:uncharacterized coiled-coil protein SlyX
MQQHNETFDANMYNRLPKAEEKRPQFKLPRRTNDAMTEMMMTIDRLRDSLVAETEALNETDTKKFMSLQDNKIDVARDYMEGITQLIARKEEMKNADPKLVDLLEQKRTEFAEVAHENHAAINRMQNGMKRLGERIMETARETAKREEQIVYGSSGHMQSGSKATIGVNESA